jgi:cystathionine beta-lyase
VLAAISTALLAVLSAGDHLLVTDSVYQPTRKFCNGVLKRYGVTTTYYDPMIGAGIAALIQPNTRAVFVEAPGSLSLGPRHTGHRGAAQGRGRADGQYLGHTALFLRLRKGRRSLDPGRHEIHRRPFDVMLGTVSANAATWASGRYSPASALRWPRDVYLGCAGSAPWACGWLNASGGVESGATRERPEIAFVLHPALDSCPAMFSGGDFSVRADCLASCSPVAQTAVNAFLDELSLLALAHRGAA